MADLSNMKKNDLVSYTKDLIVSLENNPIVSEVPEFDKNLDNVAVPKREIAEYAKKLEDLLKSTNYVEKAVENNELDLPFKAHDVYKDEKGKYKLVTISYNPLTLECRVTDVSSDSKHMAGAAATRAVGKNIHQQSVSLDKESGKLVPTVKSTYKQ